MDSFIHHLFLIVDIYLCVVYGFLWVMVVW